MESTSHFRVTVSTMTRLSLILLVSTLFMWNIPAEAGTGIGAAESVVPRGSVHLGRAAATENVSFALTLPMRNQAALNTLLLRLYNPSDTLYHHFLTPDEYAAQFGPSPSDYANLIARVTAHGFTVTHTYSNRALLNVTGPAAATESLFGVNLMEYSGATGRRFHAPDRSSVMPLDLAGLGAKVVGLNSSPLFKPHYDVMHQSVAPHGSTGVQSSGYAPQDIKNAYNLNNTKLDGTGQTLALFELDDYQQGNISAYQQAYGTGTNTPSRVNVDGGAQLSDGEVEVELDIEMMMALAPGANILVYEAPNSGQGVVDCYNQIAIDDNAPSVSTSWGIYEGITDPTSEAPAFTQMAAEGISMFAAAGDDGAYDDYEDQFGNPVDPAQLGVDDPASQPFVTGVGGTSLTLNNAATSRVSESVWGDPNSPNHSSRGSGGGGGISTVWKIPTFQSPVPVSGKPASQYSTSQRNVPDVES